MSRASSTPAMNRARLTDRTRYWIVTINTSDEDPEGHELQRSIDGISALFDNGDITYAIGSWEIGTSDSRLHIQAYIVLNKSQRGSWIAARVHRAYVIPSKYDWMNAGISYCNDPSKEGYKSKAFEFGNIPGAGQGKRTDLETVDEAIKNESAVTLRDVNDLRVSVAARHPNWVSWRLAEANRDSYLSQDRYRDQYKPRVWQHWLNVYLTECPPDERKVIFVTDRIGHAGKSRFCDEFERSSTKRSQVLRPASKRDMVASLENRREVVFIDVPRGKHQFMDTVYVFMEEAKDGKLMNEKYNSHVRYQPLLHMVVFMNEEVNIGSAGGVLTVKDNGMVKTSSYSEPVPAPLSHDRYAIWDLSQSMMEEYSIDHPKWGTIFPPFRGYDEKFRVTTYIPPLIPSSGPEFNGDIAGDGPDSQDSYATVRPFDVEYVRVGVDINWVVDPDSGNPTTFAINSDNTVISVINDYFLYNHPRETMKWYNCLEMLDEGDVLGDIIHTGYDIGLYSETYNVQSNWSACSTSMYRGVEGVRLYYRMHLDNLPEAILTQMILDEHSLIIWEVDVVITDFIVEEATIGAGAA